MAKVLAAIPIAAAAVAIVAPTAASAAAAISVSPSSGLANGKSVTVTGSGFPANTTLYVVECANLGGQAGCDITHVSPTTSSAGGAISTTFAVRTGTIGNGTCDATHSCYIAVGDAAQTVSAHQAISFAGTAASSTSSSSSSSTSSAAAGGTSTPTSVNAGSGGAADRNGTPLAVILLAVAGGAAVLGGGIRLARR